MDAMVDEKLECESPEPIIDDNEAEEEDNVAEDDESENPTDPAIIPPTLRTVTETVILKMTKITSLLPCICLLMVQMRLYRLCRPIRSFLFHI